jgi:hypothetical protein
VPCRLVVVPDLPSPTDLPPLLTDDDVTRRVALLIGNAIRDDTLWLLFVDGDDRQSRVVVPVEELPDLPDELVPALGEVLDGVLPDLATDAGPGSVVFVRERLGPDDLVPADLVWAGALGAMCMSRSIPLRGIHLSTPGAVRRLP